MANAGPTAKSIREMALLFGVWRARRIVTICIRMSHGIEVRGIVAVDLGVAVQKPDVWDTIRALRMNMPSYQSSSVDR